MDDALAGIAAKLERGDHHLERVELEVAAFLYSNPWKVTFQRQPKRGRDWYLATFEIERYPPAEWSILIGEAVHQYRSGLDHLMTELSRLRHRAYVSRPDKSPNFPICPTPGQFWAESDTGHTPADSVRKAVRPEHFTELERLQPKKPEDLRGSGELRPPMALALLRWIDDLDKHATLRPGFIAPKSIHYHPFWSLGNYGELQTDAADDPDFVEIYRPLEALHDGTQLYHARYRFGPNMSVPMTIEPDVSFGTAPYEWVTLEVLRGCFICVRSIIERFRAITPEFAA